jgi:hypothetical protein
MQQGGQDDRRAFHDDFLILADFALISSFLFWSAPVLPPPRRAKAPLRRDGGWRFRMALYERRKVVEG